MNLERLRGFMEKYDYDKERAWLSTLFEMQLVVNRSLEMRVQRLEQMVENLADDVFGSNEDSVQTGTLPSVDRWKL